MKETINFKQQRELGTIITDAFKFVRIEGKELGGLILKTTGPALLAVIFSYVYYTQSTLDNIENILMQQNFSTNVVLSIFLLLGAVLVFYGLFYSTIFLYIKSYIANQGNVHIETVSREIKEYFWGMLGLNVIIGLIVVVGLLFCVLPGIYLMVCLSLAYPILIFERNDMGDAISNSFKLIKEEWWNTFATLFVIYLLYSLITMVFQIPQLLYVFVKGFAMSNEVSGNPFDMVDWVSITLDVIAMVAGYLLFGFILITIAFVYFHLNEKKNFTGTLESIDKLGQQE